jgi:glycosyltransferase
MRGGDVLISGPDLGLYDAINKGMTEAKSEIVGLLHSDDIYASDNVLLNVVNAFKFSDCNFLYGDLAFFNNFCTRSARLWRSSSYKEWKINFGWAPPHPTIFMRRSLIQEIGLYNLSYRISADYDYVVRCMKRTDLLKPLYIRSMITKMRLGGISTRSLSARFEAFGEDFLICKQHEVSLFAPLLKRFLKLPQYALNIFYRYPGKLESITFKH